MTEETSTTPETITADDRINKAVEDIKSKNPNNQIIIINWDLTTNKIDNMLLGIDWRGAVKLLRNSLTTLEDKLYEQFNPTPVVAENPIIETPIPLDGEVIAPETTAAPTLNAFGEEIRK